MNRKSLVFALLTGLSGQALALSNTFSYQGSLQDAGLPATGSYDLQFALQTQAGMPVGTALLRDNVAVNQGVFTVELDFGSSITSADFQLQIGVRPGASAGAFTTLSPATKINPTPQAQVAGLASEAIAVSPSSITSASIANGSVASIDVNTDQIQRRVASTCASGQVLRGINVDGTVVCGLDGGAALGYFSSNQSFTASASNQTFTMNASVTLPQAGSVIVTYGAAITTNTNSCTVRLEAFSVSSNKLFQSTSGAGGTNVTVSNTVSTSERFEVAGPGTFALNLVLLPTAGGANCTVARPWMSVRIE